MTLRGAGLAAAVLGTIAATSTVAAQVFRTGVDTVLLSVTVTDGRSHSINGLARTDFRVFEDGIPQDISFFTVDPQPISLSLLVDSSTSMDDKLAVAQAAATGFVQHLGPRDVAQIVDFNNDTQIRQTFTNDARALERAILAIRTGGSTSLYTALYIAMSELARREQSQEPGEIRRQAIVVLSDGEDNSSIKTYDDVADMAKRSDVSIYAIGLRDKQGSYNRSFNEGDFALRTLSQVTGGRVFFVDDIKQLPAIYEQIAHELANQYVIGYNAKNTMRDGAWRQVAVRVDRPETVVRTRMGYFGPTKEH